MEQATDVASDAGLTVAKESMLPECDRSTWPAGPWAGEPDRIEWRTQGVVGLMVRHSRSGHWCGYVGVEPGHPWHGKRYDDVDADVHGGLTYAEHCEGNVCHVPAEGEPEHLFWLGFDCAHSGDRSHFATEHLDGAFFRGVYRDVAYVRREVERLATQAATAAGALVTAQAAPALAALRLAAIEAVRASDALPNVRALIERHRDWARDLGTHGIGAMEGKPASHEQRVRCREVERALNLLLSVLA